MYTVLIAEDEMLVRIGIASCIPRLEMNLKVIGEVSNGKKALELYRTMHPDIVITDIRMPELDGISLIREIRAEGSPCAIIIVTNVQDDEMLKSAAAYGVCDVLLKATMDPEDIAASVRKACKALPERASSGPAPDRQIRWMQYLTESAPLPCPVKQLAVMHFYRSEQLSEKLKDSLCDLLLHRFDLSCEPVLLHIGGNALLLFGAETDPAKVSETLLSLFAYLSRSFDAAVGFLQVSAAEPLKDVRALYESVCQVFLRYPEGTLPLIRTDESGLIHTPGLDSIRNALMTYVPARDSIPRAEALCETLQYFPNLFTDSYDSLKETVCTLTDSPLPDDTSPTVGRMAEQICEAAEALHSHRQALLRPEIARCLEYLQQHYGEKITTELMAQKYNYHPVYFSRLFKTELGTDFSDYLTRLRILHARILLSRSDVPVQEIADRCGFSDAANFNHRFKAITGMTPGQWRHRK